MRFIRRQVVDLHPARLDQFRSLSSAAVQHSCQHSVQPQGRYRCTVHLTLRLRKLRHLVQRQQFCGQLRVSSLKQFPADQLCCRFQRKHISCARLILRQNDISQRLAPQLKAHQTAQVILVGGQRSPRLCTALQPHTADGCFAAAVLRLDTEHLALRIQPAALKPEALLHTGTAQCRAGQVLLAVTQESRIPRNVPGKGRVGQILDMAHEIAFFIGTRRDEPARRLGLRINRTRHCSPARPADHP